MVHYFGEPQRCQHSRSETREVPSQGTPRDLLLAEPAPVLEQFINQIQEQQADGKDRVFELAHLLKSRRSKPGTTADAGTVYTSYLDRRSQSLLKLSPKIKCISSTSRGLRSENDMYLNYCQHRASYTTRVVRSKNRRHSRHPARAAPRRVLHRLDAKIRQFLFAP